MLAFRLAAASTPREHAASASCSARCPVSKYFSAKLTRWRPRRWRLGGTATRGSPLARLYREAPLNGILRGARRHLLVRCARSRARRAIERSSPHVPRPTTRAGRGAPRDKRCAPCGRGGAGARRLESRRYSSGLAPKRTRSAGCEAFCASRLSKGRALRRPALDTAALKGLGAGACAIPGGFLRFSSRQLVARQRSCVPSRPSQAIASLRFRNSPLPRLHVR